MKYGEAIALFRDVQYLTRIALKGFYRLSNKIFYIKS